MNSPATNPTASVTLSEQLAETCMLQCYLIEALDLQQFEHHLRADSEIHRIVLRALELLHQHTAQLSILLRPLRTGGRELAGSSAQLDRRFVSFLWSRRAREVTSILRDDYALLNLAALNYQMLHMSAMELDDAKTAALAANHLSALVSLSEDMTRLMPPLKARELGEIIDSLQRARPRRPSAFTITPETAPSAA